MNMQTSLTERKSYGNSTPIPNDLPFLCPPVAVLMVCVHPETRGSFHFLQELQIPSCHQREFGLVTYLSPFSINSWLLHCSSLWNTLVKTGKWNENYKENLEKLISFYTEKLSLFTFITWCHCFRFKLPPSFCFYEGCKCCFSSTPDKRIEKKHLILFLNGNFKK